MSSPSPGPNLTGVQAAAAAAGILGTGGPTRRVSTGFMSGLSTMGPSSSLPQNPPRPLTPPAQHSPNSFLTNLSARLLQSRMSTQYQNAIGRSGLNAVNTSDILELGSTNNLMANFRAMSGIHHNFGIPTMAGTGGPPSTLDLSEFPSLGGTSTTGSLLGSVGGSGRPAYVGMVKDVTPASSSSNEFTIHSEDFPALPGSNPNMHLNSGHENNTQNSVTGTGLSGILGSSAVGNELANSTSTGNSMKSIKRGIQTSKEGRVTNIPHGMVTDQFGMVGLLTFIRAAESDPNLVSLALGTDLTTLKLDLNSQENLYSTFPGPWSDQSLKTHEIDYPVPQEYLINHQIRDKLAPIKLGRYGDDTLFFLFYMFPNDMIQVAAASELYVLCLHVKSDLYVRDWRYHKDEKVWITRAPGMPPIEKTQTYERGTYYFFDAVNWRRIAKEFHLDYDRLENRPPSVAYNHLTNAAGIVPSGIVGL
ncbi:hypothetical protein B4U80_07833 [Leptotrombidium deliense]|uniref:NOT2/NOT3/NOT5 C-terminal domain-containing protein n=1 Tax=Leptotrombidium deliense TaxID=299467 RepID=A0A443SD43_9ACAR|nr:hypothetical protein B4U80_07833 [Leptotrombidium deliense]